MNVCHEKSDRLRAEDFTLVAAFERIGESSQRRSYWSGDSCLVVESDDGKTSVKQCAPVIPAELGCGFVRGTRAQANADLVIAINSN
jgi:hypothetical protein